MKNKLIFIVIIAVIFVMYGLNVIYSKYNEQPIENTQTVTQSETAPIPKGWVIGYASDEMTSFYYPQELETLYTTVSDWPPKITIVPDTNYYCTPSINGTDRIGVTEVVINDQGQEYCRTYSTEGAAGSQYTEYSFTKNWKDTSIIKMTFTLRSVQCMNYDEPNQSECITEQKNFDINGIVDTIFNTVQ